MRGRLSKMHTELASPIKYQLPLSDNLLPLNLSIGYQIEILFTGEIFCINCGRKTSKSFNQGHCFPCFKKLASCDMCILQPERCHFHLGTCREPDWAENHCMQPHIVYLANSSGLKVGITRKTQVPTRWIDQGAIQALPILQVPSRYVSGLVEVAIANFVSDKTSWQKMLKNQTEQLDMIAAKETLLQQTSDQLQQIRNQFGIDCLQPIEQDVVELNYPVEQYPEKVKSHNLDKTPSVSGQLMGIKGQYLIMDTGVINIRKFTGYDVTFIIQDMQNKS
ncbi:MAG: DUF2797 domain-containing protein [Methylococcaceae bacterium]